MSRQAGAPGVPVAVLGATGCVGRQVCATFARNGYDVLAVARRQPPHASPHRFAALDVAAADPAATARLLASHGAEVVVNATGGWARSEQEMAYAHVQLVDRLLDAVSRLGGRPRLIQIGSIHEYGPVAEGALIDESVRPRPTTAYARTKLLASAAVLRATRAGMARGVVLRVANVFGPHTTRASFLGALVARLRQVSAADQVELRVANARRDYVDARDLADAVLRAARRPVVGEVVNIGSGVALSMRELVSLVIAAGGVPPDAVAMVDGPVASKGGNWTQADIRLAQRLLGWRPRISAETSARAMWEAVDN